MYEEVSEGLPVPAEPTEPENAEALPEDRSRFNQRLASFGLGEAPDPLLTEADRARRRPSGAVGPIPSDSA